MNKKRIGLWTGSIIGVAYAIATQIDTIPPLWLSTSIVHFIDNILVILTFTNAVITFLTLRLVPISSDISDLIYEAASVLYFVILGVLVDRLRARFSRSQVFFILLGFVVVNMALIFIPLFFWRRLFASVFMGGVPPLLRKNFTGPR